MKICAALLVMLVVLGPAWAASNPEGYYLKNEQVLEQDVEGVGFAMVYQKVNTESLQLKNYMHGSGSMDAAFLIYSNQSSISGDLQDQNTLVDVSTKGVTAHAENISFVEQNEMTYSPMAMVYGTGYYAENPIVYNSKLKERTEAKNYDGSCSAEGVSMLHQIEYASAFVKDIGVELQNIDKWPPKSGYYSPKPKKGSSLTKMKIEEDVTEGSVHVGQLVAKMSEGGWKNPLIEIDENYAGSFKITKNMAICTSCTGSKTRKDWLSCCFGGYDGMDDADKCWGEEEVFDCTCRDVAWGDSWDTSKAQYCPDC
ncbi:MAG: hypothetical protein J5I35_02895 [Methanothrix harundinacea]|nr:hypothetical protein [Methanothrix harundinacea]